MKEYIYAGIDLPADCNANQLTKELPTDTYVSIVRDENGQIEKIIVNGPDNLLYSDVKSIVKAHAPIMTEQEEIQEVKQNEFEQQILSTETIKDIISRIVKLENK
jgi:hypothetical protein